MCKEMGMAQTEPTAENHVPRLPLIIVAHGFIKTCNKFWRKLHNLSLFHLFLLLPSPHPETKKQTNKNNVDWYMCSLPFLKIIGCIILK